jgi:glycosyltransferase involved in cell wall biosynthesis
MNHPNHVNNVGESLSVVVPVWNEQATIGTLVEELDTELLSRVDRLEIIVVDDASSDQTPAILAGLAEERPHLRVICSEHNRGHGASVLRGLAEASGEWVFHIDSDGQFLVSEFTRLWERRHHADLVLGRRLHRHDPAHRLVLSRLVAAAVSLLAGRRLHDANVPFKLFRRTLWEDLEPLVPTGSLAPSIFIAAGATVRGWRVVQVPVSHLARPAGRSTLRALRLLRFSARALGQLLRFWWRLRAAAPREGRVERARSG